MFIACLLVFAAPVHAGDPRVTVGREIARTNCGRCHAVGRTGLSRLKEAPPFRSLHERYPVDMLEEALAEGIVVGHPDMPKFVLEPDRIEALIAYLKSLEPRN